ncbi:hypothetical protein WJX74_002983 [Apatococcus lobatus]|uniref:Ferredoxin thioredoxin reductase alpha chain domain-containing protein n=1 Tax=Apatococcus lobatus TaxID=904363 RepID=A0AAW1SF61_9CHLO
MASCTCFLGRSPLQPRSLLPQHHSQQGLKPHVDFLCKGVKEGTRVRVTRSIPVYHAMKFKGGLDLEGKEGEVLSDVSQHKGKVLSSTLPYRIQFMVPHEEAGEVKVIAHLNGTEFEPL